MTSKSIKYISTTFLCGILTVAALYLLSIKDIAFTDGFNRKFPPHPVLLKQTSDLAHNSFYIAGLDNEHLFLGNYTAPLLITTLDHDFKSKRTEQIKISDTIKKFRSIKIVVQSQEVYLIDGQTPIILKGETKKWQLSQYPSKFPFFTEAVPISNESIAIRAVSRKTKENIIGKVKIGQAPIFFDRILKKQVDGLFCTDGIFIFNIEQKKLIYLYYYRNQFLCLDSNLIFLYSANTIDTNTRAKITTARLQSTNSVTMSSPPSVVNKGTTVYKNWLFVNSNVIADNEDKTTAAKASVIDVYDLNKRGRYLFSFYLFDHQSQKLSSFRIHNDKLFAIFGRYIQCYQLNGKYFPES